MLKRRFYKKFHGDNSSDSSSSSDSDSDSIPEVEEGEEEEDEVEIEQQEKAIERDKEKKSKKIKIKKQHSPSPGSGYESEDSSGNEFETDPSGLLTEEEEDIKRGDQNLRDGNEGGLHTDTKASSANDPLHSDLADCILQCKSVFKCKLCPRIVCLSEDTIKAHLHSKRHARSTKLLKEGRLKLMLNSDGEIEEDQETHAERHSRTVALAQESVAPVRKDKGRQRQSRRRKKRLQSGSNKGKSDRPTKRTVKKQRKNED